jgi:hypothetical protein
VHQKTPERVSPVAGRSHPGTHVQGHRTLRDQINEESALKYMTMLNGFDFIGGGNKTSAASTFIRLKHWGKKPRTYETQ